MLVFLVKSLAVRLTGSNILYVTAVVISDQMTD